VFLPNAEILESIAKGATHQELQRTATAAGMRGMRDVALEKARQGKSTLQEIERVLGEGGAETTPTGNQRIVATGQMVLLVDDDPTVRTLARLVLEKNGFRVSEVSDGPSALKHFASGQECGLTVLDLDMPGLNGLEVLRQLRATPETAGVPVVVLTGSDGGEAEVDAMDAGADDYMRKPLEPARFVARVKAALRRAGN
jgi:CheY-like chemotaxis protein